MSAAVMMVVILTSVDAGPASARDVVAKSSQQVSLHAAVRRRSKGRCELFTSAPRVKTRCKVRPFPAGTRFEWFKVEGARAAYDNVPGGRFAFASIDWIKTPWRAGTADVPADVAPAARRGLSDAGTMRYEVKVIWPDGRTRSSPELSARRGGPTRRQDIRKVTLRRDDSYLGYMTELAGLPYIFGSAAAGREPHQAERKIGVDCADLMIYGLRRLGHSVGYRSSRTLGPVSRPVVPRIEARRGGVYLTGGKSISVGPGGVRPGDWLIFEGHVGAFVEDRGTPGVLDDRDLMMHIAWRELAIEPLADSGYGAVAFEIRRPNALAPVGSN